MSNIFTRLLLNADGFNKNLYQAQKNLRGFAATSKGVFSGLTTFTSYAAAFVGISTSIHSAVTANMEFEKSLSSLRSLTGVSAQELNYFRTEAIRMGMDSTQSASQMVDAFKLIGSQMPELLKNKTALTQTAEAAVVLAEAAELDVPTAAKALTGALNQMGASSSEAANYINILAAASQQGSADIPYLNKAIEKAGGAASSTGVKFNELVAIIEAIAPKITDAASAGTNLRNIFLTLESSADQNLRPSVVGLSTAIDNLSKMNLDAVQLTKMFGKESVTAAIAILQEKDAFDELSQSIKDTNTAYDQAAINNDNLSGSIGKLQSSWTSFINTMAGSNGILKGIVDDLRDAVNWANRAMMTADERYQYDTQNSRRIEREESNKRIQKYIDSGMSREDALNKEIQTANYMYPEAKAYQVRERDVEKKRKEWERAKLVNINGAAFEEEKAYKEAVKLLEISKNEFTMRQAIYDNVEAQRKSLEQANREQVKAKEESEAAAKVAKEKAAAEEAARLAKEKASRPDGSIADVEYQISQKKKEISVAISDNDRIRLSTELDELISKKREMELVVKFKDLTAPEEVKKSSSSLASMARLDDGWNKISQTNWNDKGVKEQISTINEYENAILSVESALSSLSGTFDNGSQSALSYFTNIIQGAAQAVTAIMALIPVKKAEANANAEAAVTGAASSVAPIPFVGAAMAVAAVAALIASMAAIPKFAKGGIIGGSSFYGDRLLARVNSGEMILNKEQQKSLYQMTSGENDINITSFKVRGDELFLVLKNYMKKTGKKL
ncbi:phage tail tape measure protein [Phocaeicola plebeius]|uniref:phage tail tape measure protein n=1 Tax=Phocaeicola plebeius TaxID=310297 RepID=UPI00291E4D83|nr:tail length tape measure protein [uncultured phage]CAJ1889793.1 tail length tape measure protein [uncultured phage]